MQGVKGNVPSTAIGGDARRDRLQGLDSIRFVCAFLVVLGHISFTDPIHGSHAVGLIKVAIGLYNVVFVGQAAVIAFFIISGFCIHFPYREKRNPALIPFYARRFLRVVPPAIICFLILRKIAFDFVLNQSILWSVICEICYYCFYPALLVLRRLTSWGTVFAISLVAAAVLIGTHLGSMTYGAGYMVLGWSTWIIGLPCWLLGCWLAENYHRFSAPSVAQIWGIRVGIYVLAVTMRIVRFHFDSVVASNCILLDCYSLPACLWIGFEIAYFLKQAPMKSLEWAGSWSYSLYIVHPMVEPLFLLAGLTRLVQNPRTHFLLILVALFASYLFFLLVESPCHRLAVSVGRFADNRFRPSAGHIGSIANS